MMKVKNNRIKCRKYVISMCIHLLNGKWKKCYESASSSYNCRLWQQWLSRYSGRSEDNDRKRCIWNECDYRFNRTEYNRCECHCWTITGIFCNSRSKLFWQIYQQKLSRSAWYRTVHSLMLLRKDSLITRQKYRCWSGHGRTSGSAIMKTEAIETLCWKADMVLWKKNR